jgi:hypothetical protein
VPTVAPEPRLKGATTMPLVVLPEVPDCQAQAQVLYSVPGVVATAFVVTLVLAAVCVTVLQLPLT